MILRGLSIALAVGAALALWFGYAELRMLRGTVFWEYRYIVFVIVGFLGLSLLEWVHAWIKGKIDGDQSDH